MIPAVLTHDDLLADIAAPGSSAGGLCVWWLGQSGFLVKSSAGTVLFDPYLSDSLTHKYAGTDKPHVRMTELCVDPARLTGIDVITSTHNHTDHLDADTLVPLLAANPTAKLVIPEANRSFVLKRVGCEPSRLVGLNAGESASIGAITLHGVPAAHDQFDLDEHGRHRYLGYVARLGGMSVYHSGDTRPFPGMADVLRPFNVDLALLPINGHAPHRRVAGNLFGDEAAQLAHDIGAALVVPCHYDMFTFNTEPPDLFVASCRSLGQSYRVLRCGERLHVLPRR